MLLVKGVTPDIFYGTYVPTEDGRLLWRHDFSTAAILVGGEIAFGEGDDRVYMSQQNRRAPGGSLTVLGSILPASILSFLALCRWNMASALTCAG